MGGSAKLMTPGGGGVIIQPASSIAADVTVQVPSQNCTLGIQGPAFSAYANTNQSISSNVATKAQLNSEVFDTANCFDTSTYRFTPNVSGYYQFSFSAYPYSTVSSTGTRLYKNGASVAFIDSYSSAAAPGSALIYMNGSTDYIELYVYLSGTSPVIFGRQDLTYLQGCLVRAA